MTYLVNVRLSARGARNDVLDELGHLAHDIDTVSSLSKAARQHSGFGTALPLESDNFWFGPGVV